MVFPWGKGTSIDQIYAFYTEIVHTDLTHPDSQAPVLKAQHPEFETYTAASTHYTAGVACADCHMPTVKTGGQMYTVHNIRSPLVSA